MTVVVQELNIGPEGGPVCMVKDTIDIAGYATRAGSRSLADAPPAAEHAVVVRRLLEDGWRITGKTNLHELAFGTTGINNYTGTPENPLFPDLIPGGSSSGSAAAVAAGLCDSALGTDTGGSVRIPAACCGVFGLKPTFGRVSRTGVMPAETSLDCVGPFAASAAMLTRCMSSICPGFLPVSSSFPLTAGRIRGAFSENPAITEAVDRLLEKAGFEISDTSLDSVNRAYDAGMTIINRESWKGSEHLLASGQIGIDVADRLRKAGETTDQQLSAAETVRQQFTSEVDTALSRFTVLALPTMPEFPPAVENAADTQALLGITALVRPFNLSGHPAVSIPVRCADGRPAGLQLVAAAGQDELLCYLAEHIEKFLS